MPMATPLAVNSVSAVVERTIVGQKDKKVRNDEEDRDSDGTAEPGESSADRNQSRRGQLIRRALVIAPIALYVGSILALTLTGNDLVAASSDEGAGRQRLWTLLLPTAFGFALAVLIPLRQRPVQPATGPRPALLRRTWLLIGLAVVFPIVVGLASWGDSIAYIGLKVVLFLVIPPIAFAVLRRRTTKRSSERSSDRSTNGPAIEPVTLPSPFPRAAWQWWAPLPVVALWALVAYAGPLAPPVPTLAQFPDPLYVAVAAAITFVTASVGEEIFYRYWLQTHLEAVAGKWVGVLGSALIFAFMHIATHGAAGGWTTLATAIAIQGTHGLFLAYLWAKYRNLAVTIAVPATINGMPIILYFLSLT